MKFTSFFIKNPVYAIVFNVMLIVVGILSLNSLKVREYPKVEIPRISVWTTYRNASPEVIESAVTAPLEDELAGVEGVEFIRSYSNYESSWINLQFREGASMDKAVASVRDALGRIRGRLPKDVREPSISRDNGNEGNDVLMILAVQSEKMNSLELRHFIETTVKNAFRSVDGVSAIGVYGDNYLAKVLLDPKKLHMFGLNADDIYDAIDSENVLRPVGKIRNTISASMKSKIETKDDFQRIILRARDSKFLKNPKRSVTFLKDVADIVFSVDDQCSRCLLNGQKGTFITIKAASDANPVEVSNRVLQKIENLKTELTADVKISVLSDDTDFIRASIKNAEKATLEAVILVLLIVFLFLGNFRATLVPIVTIPISLIGAIVFLKAFGFSINIMTLLAMVLAVGLVVDDAIVVLENISRRIENGMSTLDATLKGSGEISAAIVAMTLTLVSVYAPLAFIEGAIGQLFIEFAVALAGSVLISGFVALTLSPLMCSVLLKDGRNTRAKIFPKFDAAFRKISETYGRFLEHMQSKQKLSVIIAIASLIFSFAFLKILPQQTAPSEDRGMICGSISQIAGKNVDFYEAQLKKVQKFLDDVPEILHSLNFANLNNGFMNIILKPKNERSRTSREIATELQDKMHDFPSVDVIIWNEDAQLPGVSNDYGDSYASIIISTSDSYQDLYNNLEKARAEFLKNPIFEQPRNGLLMNNRVYKIHIDNDKVAKLGLSKEKIARTLEMFFSGNRNLHFEKDGIEYPIVVETTKKCSDLSEIYVTNNQGKRISLDVVAKMVQSTEAPQFFHYNQMRSAYFGFGIAKGENFEKVLQAGMKILNEVLPISYKKTLQGVAEQTKKSTNTMLLLFVLSIIFIYAVLALQFNNFRDPLIILLTAPLACCGALFGIWLTNSSMNIYTAVGLITLVGLITKHGIMIVEFANQLIEQGKSTIDAIHQAAKLRFRPILITAGAMFLGSIPLVISQDYGCESRRAIGIVLTFGLFFGTIFVLMIFPNLCVMAKNRRKNV